MTEEALKMYADLLESLDESERGKLQRSMGLKMEQLKVGIPLRALQVHILRLHRAGVCMRAWASMLFE